MKRFFCAFCAVFLTLGMLTACSNNRAQASYEVMISAFSDAVPSVEYEIEYEIADREKFDSITPQPEISVTIQGKTYTGSFDGAKYYNSNYFPTYEYYDEKHKSNSLDEQGKLIGCFFGTSKSNTKTLSQEECVQIAKDFLSGITDISQYTISVTENRRNTGGFYEVVFQKSIGGFETTDKASVSVQFNGDIYAYSSQMLGRVPADTKVSDIELKGAKASVYDKLDNLYRDVEQQFDAVEYGEPVFQLTILKDGSRGLYGYVDIAFIYEYSDGYGRMSERLNVVIPLP